MEGLPLKVAMQMLYLSSTWKAFIVTEQLPNVPLLGWCMTRVSPHTGTVTLLQPDLRL